MIWKTGMTSTLRRVLARSKRKPAGYAAPDGSTLQVLINGGMRATSSSRPSVRSVGSRCSLSGIVQTDFRVGRDTELERAYYTCAACEQQTLFPLDQKLQLRRIIGVKGGAGGDAARPPGEVLCVSSHGLYRCRRECDVGESLRRITEGWGHQVEVRRQAEAERASLPGQRDESPRARRCQKVGR